MRRLDGYTCPRCKGNILYDQNSDTYICEGCLEEYYSTLELDQEETE